MSVCLCVSTATAAQIVQQMSAPVGAPGTSVSALEHDHPETISATDSFRFPSVAKTVNAIHSFRTAKL